MFTESGSLSHRTTRIHTSIYGDSSLSSKWGANILCYVSHRCSPRFVHITLHKLEAIKNIDMENLIDATLVSRFGGWRQVVLFHIYHFPLIYWVLAIRAIHDMLKAPDFDRQMLLLATQISHQSEMKGVLLAVLESLLKTLKIGSGGEIIIEAMRLIRCIVKLVLSLLVEPAANK